MVDLRDWRGVAAAGSTAVAEVQEPAVIAGAVSSGGETEREVAADVCSCGLATEEVSSLLFQGRGGGCNSRMRALQCASVSPLLLSGHGDPIQLASSLKDGIDLPVPHFWLSPSDMRTSSASVGSLEAE